MDLKPFSAFLGVDVEGIIRSPRSLFVRLRTSALQHLGAQAGIVMPGQD